MQVSEGHWGKAHAVYSEELYAFQEAVASVLLRFKGWTKWGTYES